MLTVAYAVVWLVLPGSQPEHLEASGYVSHALNPKNYLSPSGEYRLEVDPSTKNGQGEGTYRLTRGGTEVWSDKHPFTLWDAAVTDDGTVAGYAYSYGWAGVPESRPNESAPNPGDSLNGDFRVVILDSAGGLRLSESTRRRYTGALHAPSEPVAKGIFIDAENDRFVVKVVGPGSDCEREWWWTYRLSTGRRLDRFEPRRLMPNAESACFVIDDQPIRRTPLTLLQWEISSGGIGTRFTLINSKGNPVWILDLPRGHELTGDPVADSLLRDEIRRQSAMLRSNRPGRVELLANKQRLAFQATESPDSPTGWRVSETAPANDIAPPTSAPAPAEPASMRLERLGTITLEGDHSLPHPIRRVDNFEFDGRGRIAFIRREDQGPGTFVLVRADGKIEREVPLRGISDDWWPHPLIAWIDNDRWIIVVSSYKMTKARAWWLDIGSSSLTPVGAFDHWSVRAVTGTGDGGFAFLTDDGELIAIDDGGCVLRRILRRPDRHWIEWIDAAAVAPNGSIAVLACRREFGSVSDITVNLYGPTGDPIRTIPMPNARRACGLAYTGKQVIVSQGPELLILSTDDGSAHRFRPTPGTTCRGSPCWHPVFWPTENELWLLRSGCLEIERYALSEATSAPSMDGRASQQR